MTLEQFFHRIIEKIMAENNTTPASGQKRKDYQASIDHLRNLIIEERRRREGLIFSRSSVASSWSYVMEHTGGGNFYDEFRGDLELEAALAQFLTA